MALTHRKPGRLATLGLALGTALTLTACSDDTAGPEEGATVEDIQEEDDAVEPDVVEDEDAETDAAAEEDVELQPYDGIYDTNFYEDVDTYVGQEVTVSADVNEVLSPTSFTIAGTEDTDVAPLLVVSAEENNELAPDLTVAVTGTVREAFDLVEAEETLGVDLEDDLYTDWDGEPYIEASAIDTSVASDE